jgi:2-phospho-L-lactate guanylyltransferase
LNAALARATNAVITFNARGALILASDMPLMAVQDIEAMLEKAKQPPVMVIATDRRQDGTNALLISPAGLITYSYGEGSFQRHIQEGKRVGLTVHVYESERLALDIDTPEDLEQYRARLRDNGGGHSERLPKVEAGSGA